MLQESLQTIHRLVNIHHIPYIPKFTEYYNFSYSSVPLQVAKR